MLKKIMCYLIMLGLLLPILSTFDVSRVRAEETTETSPDFKLVFGKNGIGTLMQDESERVYLEGAEDYAIAGVTYSVNNDKVEVDKYGNLSIKEGVTLTGNETVTVTADVTYYDKEDVVFADSFEGDVQKFETNADRYQHSATRSLYGRKAATPATTKGTATKTFDEALTDVTVTMWFYDANAPVINCDKFLVRINGADANTEYSQLGVMYTNESSYVDGLHKTNYACMIPDVSYAKYSYGATTNVQRSADWHKFEWIIDSQNGLTIEIDDTVVETHDGVSKTAANNKGRITVKDYPSIKELTGIAISNGWVNESGVAGAIVDKMFVDGVSVVKNNATTKTISVSCNQIQLKEYTSLTDDDLEDNGTADVDKFGPVPSEKEYEYHRQEIAAFLHFGMNTYTGSEWGSGNEKPAQFTLTEKVDADAYVKTLKEAGFQKLIVTAKHHDGFCIWDSAWTEHDTASTGYPGGDVLADISEACTKYDMDMGLYLSPWDVNSVYYGYYDAEGKATTAENDVLDYNDYYDGQLEEILGNDKYGNNGKFVEMWLDGAKGSGSEAQEYDFDRFVRTMKKHEGEDLLLFIADNEYRNVIWVGNELGVASDTTWSKVLITYDEEGNYVSCDPGTGGYFNGVKVKHGAKNGNRWAIMECDARITSGWFWGENKKTPVSLEGLRNMYLYSVGHNAPLLLNVPMNKQGKLDEAIEERLLEWSKNVKESFFDNNLAAAEGVTISADSVHGNDIKFKPSNVVDGNDLTYWTATQGEKNAKLYIDFGKEVEFDALTIEEEILHGQRVEAFTVYAKTDTSGWIKYAEGTTIGAKRVILGRCAKATQIRIDFQGMTDDNGVVGTPVISHVGVYKSTDAFELDSGAPDGITVIDNLKTNFTADNWSTVEDTAAIDAGYYEGKENDTMTISFTGTKAWVMGLNSDTTLSVSVDGNTAETVSVSGDVLFETGDLSDGEHIITLTVLSGTAKVDALYVLNNGGKGLLDFEFDTYTVDEDMWFKVKVVRKGGSNGIISAIVQDNPGSAVQSSYVPTEGIPMIFEDGETEKSVRIRTKRYTETTGTLSFYLDLVAGEGETDLIKGMNSLATVNIIDAEGYPNGYLQKIEVTADPTKTEYGLNETLDTAGLQVTGFYSNGAEEILPVTSGSGLGQCKTVTLESSITTQNLRLIITGVLDGVTEIPSINEIKVYGAEETTNLALSATAHASSVHSSCPVTRINDGNTGNNSRWSASNTKVSKGGLPCWVELSWDEPVTISKIEIYEWTSQRRAGTWELSSVTYPTSARVMDLDQYDITPEGIMTTLGEVVYTVTAKEDVTKTDTFTVNVVERDVTGVTLDVTKVSLKVDETKQLTATVLPETATDKSVTWSSSDATVAIVDKNGKVTAICKGETMITVTTANGNMAATCVVTVTLDTSDIDTAIASANTIKTGVEVIDGKDAEQVEKGSKFVSTAEMKALTDAISVAEHAKETAKTTAEVTASVNSLNQAIDIFRSAIKTGVYILDDAETPDKPDDKDTEQNKSDEEQTVVSGTVTTDESETTGADAASTDGTASPKTGDTNNILLWVAMLVLSCGAFAAVIVSRRKRKEK